MLAGVVIHKPYAIPAVTLLWTGAERILEVFNFTWLKLGNAAVDMGIPMRLAPYTGVYGVSFVFALMSAGLASVLLRRSRKELAWMLLLTPLYLLPPLPAECPAPDAEVVVQPNLPDDNRCANPHAEDIENRLGHLPLTA